MAGVAAFGVPTGIYYVVLYGESGHPVFVNPSDPDALSELVARLILRCHASIHAYCWLWRQLRMVIQVQDVSLPGLIQRLASQHARSMNRKLRRKGYLFEHPHRSVVLDDSISVLEAVRHVHLSPLEQAPTVDPSRYRWSSNKAYLNLEEVPWLTTRLVTQLLQGDQRTQPIPYDLFMADGLEGASGRAVSAASRWIPHYRADDAFVARLKGRLAERVKPVSLDRLIEVVARQYQVSPTAITSRSRSPSLSLARALVAWYAVQHGIASLAEVARRLGRGRSSLHETREKYRALEPEAFRIPLAAVLQRSDLRVSDKPCVGHDKPHRLADQKTRDSLGRGSLSIDVPAECGAGLGDVIKRLQRS